jgi:hypothetical protein
VEPFWNGAAAGSRRDARVAHGVFAPADLALLHLAETAEAAWAAMVGAGRNVARKKRSISFGLYFSLLGIFSEPGHLLRKSSQ